MYSVVPIIKKLKTYTHQQQFIDMIGLLLISMTIGISAISCALILFKSPWYGLLGIIALFFYRPRRIIESARNLENKIGLKGELVNSIQLARIDQDNKEKYSAELITAYIADTARTIAPVDLRKYLSYKPIYRNLQYLLIAVVFSLIHPALAPGHFWYALNHTIAYRVEPGNGDFCEGETIDIMLALQGVYIPGYVELITQNNDIKKTYKILVEDGCAHYRIELNSPLIYYFSFLDHATPQYTLNELEQVYIEELNFSLVYPIYTRLKNDIKTGRQLIAPEGTKVAMKGKASQPLESGRLILNDTIALECQGDRFSTRFEILESGISVLYLKGATELKEQIMLYAVPDLPPLIDIFYPGFNINLPRDMQIDIGIRCSDDYGLNKALFYYDFEGSHEKKLDIKHHGLEDTVYFKWDISELGMLPGDEIVYYAEITDNAGKVSKSKSYYVYFPTMEEIYEGVDKKEELVQSELEDLKEMHNTEMEEISRLQEKIMKERSLQWADQEKLLAAMSKEQKVLESIDEWQNELEKTVEQLQEGAILDQESIERLQEITKILQEIAPDDMRKALAQLQKALDKRPQDIARALDELKKQQEEIAKAIERTLAILKRFQQEQKIKELAETAEDLAEQAGDIDRASERNDPLSDQEAMNNLKKSIEDLVRDLQNLADDKSLEQEIRDMLEQLAQKNREMAGQMPSQPSNLQKNLEMTAADLQKLYEKLTSGRSAQLREKLLDIVNQLIDISKAEEDLTQEKAFDIKQQNEIINATKAVAESLYAQELKSLHVTPEIGKKIASAVTHMEKAKDVKTFKYNTNEAMKQINLSCLEILKKLEQAAQGTSSSGMDNFLQQLSGISQGQLSLMQSMNGFFPIPAQGLTSSQKAQISRLADKQKALRQSLEALRSEAGAGQPVSMLDKIIDEMKQTEDELYKYKLDRELIERQQKIISRLLDAQKSIRKEDYEKKRKSKTGQEFLVRENPDVLPREPDKDKLQDLIQQALRESYPKEYELYIREYFKKLLEER
jgi:hypothetical protein